MEPGGNGWAVSGTQGLGGISIAQVIRCQPHAKPDVILIDARYRIGCVLLAYHRHLDSSGLLWRLTPRFLSNRDTGLHSAMLAAKLWGTVGRLRRLPMSRDDTETAQEEQ